MTAHGNRGRRGASNLPVILFLVAATLVLGLVLFMRGGVEDDAPSKPVPTTQKPPPARQPPVVKQELVRHEDPSPPPVVDPEPSLAAREPERYEAPPDYSDYLRNPVSTEIPPEIREALEHPPEMPEELRRAIERGQLNQIPTEFQALLDGPRPQVSAAELEQLHRQATEPYIPPDILEQFEEAGRRMNAGRP